MAGKSMLGKNVPFGLRGYQTGEQVKERITQDEKAEKARAKKEEDGAKAVQVNPATEADAVMKPELTNATTEEGADTKPVDNPVDEANATDGKTSVMGTAPETSAPESQDAALTEERKGESIKTEDATSDPVEEVK